MRGTLILEALETALEQRRTTPGLLLHSDRGFLYRGHDYQDRLTTVGLRSSMRRKGICWDDAVMESFFSRLEVELIYPEAWRTFGALRGGLFEYLEIFYNRRRHHSAPDCLSPAQYAHLPNPATVSMVFG